ncbi:MAG: dUTP diphosphatase [Deltaproteobacteria bacterium]|jgi:dUTP pyrophosphatase|nr:dUTP diphosphatase [Deltaproteobacteria bacterium]
MSDSINPSDATRADSPVLYFQRKAADPAWPLPARGSEWASGLDLSACVDADLTINAGEIKLIPTGWAVAVPHGYEGQVRPRSGVAAKLGLTVINTPGTVDSDYRGEIFIALVNLSGEPRAVSRGQRLAQLVICPVIRPQAVLVEELTETVRGSGAFGSTGA